MNAMLKKALLCTLLLSWTTPTDVFAGGGWQLCTGKDSAESRMCWTDTTEIEDENATRSNEQSLTSPEQVDEDQNIFNSWLLEAYGMLGLDLE